VHRVFSRLSSERAVGRRERKKDFLHAWFSGERDADFNGSGAISVQDLFDFLRAWFTGCP